MRRKLKLTVPWVLSQIKGDRIKPGDFISLKGTLKVRQRVQRALYMQVREHHNVRAWTLAGERAS